MWCGNDGGRDFLCTFADVMIVANMNLHEVYNDLMGEMSKLEWKRDALIRKALAAMKKSDEYPAYAMYDYQIQASKNQYIIYFHLDHPFAPISGGYLSVLFDGSKRYIMQWATRDVPEILVLTSHFLQRYKERFLKQPELSANEVAVRFLSRNRKLRPVPVDERISKRIEEYGEFAGEGFLAADGFCFKLSGEETIEAEDTIRISFFTTFMPLSEMSYSQRDAIFDECMTGLKDL